jgi:hypothetical protein
MPPRVPTEVVSEVRHDVVSPSEELTEWYRLALVIPVLELKAEADLDCRQKLAILHALIDNIFHVMSALLSNERAADRELTRLARPAQMKRKRCAASPRRRAAFIKPT